MLNSDLPALVGSKEFLSREIVRSLFSKFNVMILETELYNMDYVTAGLNCRASPNHGSMICGDMQVFKYSVHKMSGLAGQEEMEIRASGQCPFGAEMRPSGPFSNGLLGRLFGRDNPKFKNKPHIVLVDKHVHERLLTGEGEKKSWAEFQKNNIPVYVVTNEEFPRISKTINKEVEDRIVQLATKQKGINDYNRGLNEGAELSERRLREAYNRGYKDGKESAFNV